MPTAPTTSTIDKNYFKAPTETIDQYNQRIQQYNASKAPKVGDQGTTLIQDQTKAANQGKPGFDALGNPIPGYQAPTDTQAKNTQTSYSPTDTSQAATDADPMVQRAKQAEVEQQAFQKQQDDIQNGVIPLSVGDQAQIDNLKQIYDSWIADQKLTNTGAEGTANVRGYQTGAAEYDPTFQQKTIGAISAAGLTKIKALQTEEVAKVAQLTQALKDVKLSASKAAYDELTKVHDDLATAIQNHVDKVQKAIKDAQDAKIAADKVVYDQAQAEKKDLFERVTKPISDIQEQVLKNTGNKELATAVGAAQDVASALALAGDALQSATGDLGRYIDYKRQADATGKVVASYDDWLKADKAATAKEKANEAYATAYASAAGKAAGENASGGGNLKPLTEVQAKDLTYAQRGDNAGAIINNLQNKIVAMSPYSYTTQKTAEGFDIGNQYVSSDIRQMRQAERDFATAILRRESGASISPSEFATVESQYFPRPGDDAITLAQKAQNRDTAINSFKANVPSYDQRVNQTTTGLLEQAEKIANDTLTNYKDSHPEKASEINNNIQVIEKQLGRPASATEFLEAFPEYK